MKVLLRSSFISGAERGQDSFELILALTNLGMDVFIDPVDVHPPLPNFVTTLLTKPYSQHFDLAIHMVDPTHVEMPGKWKSKSSASGRVDLNILWTSYPFTMFPTSNKKISPSLKEYDVILAQDEHSFNIFSDPKLNHESVPVGILSPGYISEQWKPLKRSHDGPFRFCSILAGTTGELPEVLIEAFHKIRQSDCDFEDIELVIKTVPEDDLNMKLMDNVEGLTIIKQHYDDKTMNKFFKDMHCLVSTDTGGVRNRAGIEFLSTGGTAIATNFSLNTNWCRGGWAYPLKYELKSLNHKDVRVKYAYPDLFDLEEKMIKAIDDRNTYTASYGQLASQMMPMMFDWNVVVETMISMVKELVPESGSTLNEKFLRMSAENSKEDDAPWKN